MGERFGESLNELKDSQLRRLFKLILHISSGRNAAEALVEAHPLRTSEQRDAAPHTRADGAGVYEGVCGRGGSPKSEASLLEGQGRACGTQQSSPA
jgi:hypothetical protein